MRSLKLLSVALALGAIPLAAAGQQQTTLAQVVDKIVAQEQVEVQSLRQYSPIVETYIQTLRSTKERGVVPDGDKYFLGRADLAKGVELEPLINGTRNKHNLFGGLGNIFSMEFLPRGFLQMIYLDTNGFDRQHYKFNFIGREFLGEIRCLVFDIDPLSKGASPGASGWKTRTTTLCASTAAITADPRPGSTLISTAGVQMRGRTNGSLPSSTAKKWTIRQSRRSRRKRAFGATLPTTRAKSKS
jgi:hypothetical protein